MELFDHIWKNIRLATVMDLIDILIVAALIYQAIKFMRGTKAEKSLKGLLILLVVLQLSEVLQLHMIKFVLNMVMQVGLIALVIIFQPELRKMLEQFGRNRFLFFKRKEANAQGMQTAIYQTVEAVSALSWSKTGALIIFEKEEPLTAIINTGTTINADVNAELLKNIFFVKAPLHDGAVIISNGRIAAAGCILPLSGNLKISKDLGTRHRAAVGMSENYDSLSVVVSEETGAISMASGGMLKRHLAPETLERMLINELMPHTEEKEKRSYSLKRYFRSKSK
ncbi:MAG: diadenylate cyclase CdaA [Clostridia bacterium]|nr:diadenylate cyclase CdaA [Clostridia bacterium]